MVTGRKSLKTGDTFKQFNIRLNEDLVRRVKIHCIEKDINYADFVAEALERRLPKSS
jgi:predicted DNA binding CopG/RHH family protein